MRGLKFILAVSACFSGPAIACRDEPELRLSWLKTADLIVIAQVSNYRIVPDFHDSVAAGYRYELLQKALTATPEQRTDIQRRVRLASDFARIDVTIAEVLAGAAPANMDVTWDTGWFRLPDELAPGSYLLALRAPGKVGISPARARSWTVLSPTCERSFLVESGSAAAAEIRQELLRNRPKPK